jgi:NADH dehydrogenase FAD-containing subunit
MLNVVIIGASTAGHIIASQLAPKLPATHRIVIIDPAPTSYWPIASLRAAVVPGFESKVYHRLEQKNFFPADSKNVLVRQRVVSVEPASIVLDGEFEGSSQVPFDVSRSRRVSSQSLSF